jgi:2-polyprenyl-6-methoxyphenol hydroxylase-like FAD-dependent oxidoreductase
MLAACLARWGYRIKHIDNRAHPTPAGRADGIQPRSLDLLRNLALKPAIMAHSPTRIYETAFWTAGDLGQGIVRTGTSPSCPDALDARYPFTTLLHQGRIEQVFISDIEQRGLVILRPWTITNFETTFQNPDYPIVVKMAHVDGTACETVHTKYLFSGEGAKSFIRKRLKINVSYKEPTTSVWAVIDGTVRSDFPDIKVRSANVLLFLCAYKSRCRVQSTVRMGRPWLYPEKTTWCVFTSNPQARLVSNGTPHIVPPRKRSRL